jgi:predicted transcriptional regulator
MPHSKTQLGDLERAVMDVLWTVDEPRTVREVYEQLVPARDIAYTTVMTVLDRLAKKGLLVQHREGRAYHYRARASRAELTAELMRDTLEGFGEEARGPALVAFVAEASPDDVAALRRALDALS